MRSLSRLLVLLAVLLAAPVASGAQSAPHRLVIHVDSPTRATMLLALHNAGNVMDYYSTHGGSAAIEIVANGRGVTMFAKVISPVLKDVAEFHQRYPTMVFDACALSLAAVGKSVGRTLEVMPEARVVPSGAVQILELEEQHYGYMKP